MISENRLGLGLNPWGVVIPAILIALLTIGTNTFGDAVARVSIGAAGRRNELAVASASVGASDDSASAADPVTARDGF